MLNEKKWKDLISDDFLSAAAFNPNLIGPTLPPIPPFTLPTGTTGPTGATGPTGPTATSCIRTDPDNGCSVAEGSGTVANRFASPAEESNTTAINNIALC
ncbi:exosporium leader peptide-containing protein [Bacillus anthracis]|uniref:exosporium leader peptide-containing protein n=1 Tax=Bacillus cereus group TaxID=86661 RepID=UPI002DC9DBF1|nr:exosporium leader peptide-containing protein [Bacillus anthracis]